MNLPVNQHGKLKCSIEYTLNKIGNKWKSVILWHLGVDGTLRYSKLRSLLPGVSHKVMTAQLKELEQDGLVERIQYNTVPPKVEYLLTEKGQSVMPILELMHAWGVQNGEDF